MCSPAAAGSKILYRNSRLLRMAFLQLHRQQRADVFCDVILQAEGEAIPAHCCILSACSPFFTERLEREMPPKGRKVVLELRGLKIGTLRKLVDFLYTSEMEVSREEAQDVLAAARQLQVSELESLKLEGGKLVKQALGRRLNRECLQSPSSAPISARVMLQACEPCPAPTPTVPRTSSPMVAGKQDIVAKPSNNSEVPASPRECVQQGAATAAAPSKGARLGMQDSSVTSALPTETEGTKPQSCLVRSLCGGRVLRKGEGSQGKRNSKQVEQNSSGAGNLTEGSPLPRKIKLSRLKLPSPASIGATEAPSAKSLTKANTSIKRLWRQKKPGGDETGQPEQASLLRGSQSSTAPLKASIKKRSPSTSASSSDTASEEGRVRRVKLRKVVNGSCWEVVQEPAAQGPPKTTGQIDAEPATEDMSFVASSSASESCNLSCLELPGTRLAGSAEQLPGRLETAPFPEEAPVEQTLGEVLMGEQAGCGNPCELEGTVLDQLSEGDEFGNLAPLGDLEQMLDSMLAGNSSAMEGTCLPKLGEVDDGQPSAGPSCQIDAASVDADVAAGREWQPLDMHLWPEWNEASEVLMPGGEQSRGSPLLSSAAEDAVGYPVCGQLVPPFPADPNEALPSSYCPSPMSAGLSSPHNLQCHSPLVGRKETLSDLGSPVPVEDGGGDRWEPCTTWSVYAETAGMETTPDVQVPLVLQQSTLKEHGHWDCHLTPPSDSPGDKMDEIIDVTGAEEGPTPISVLCVKPDPSSESDDEVDVLN
ncbi:PREDICTED: BTB/POZ domain-containing protein 18 [Crocodylus porosus]|uniref:BTB/POZ domain-containing protein 18 n=1 Tax=Crocodylus porosus TaxID=8502 RepID=UPI000938DB58|nr:PREDICTED: BTB/POZ domain-containing protein 18 [Crocodylus porosus]